MRKELKSLYQQRMEFVAVVERFGTKSAFRGPPLETILLKDVARADNGEIVTDHLWFAVGKSWKGFRAGDRVAFTARVGQYEKGYFGRREGGRLSAGNVRLAFLQNNSLPGRMGDPLGR